MHPKALAVLPILISSLVLAGDQGARAQFDPLIQYVPDSTNVVILYNAEKVFASPVAKREGWRKNYEKAYAAGLVRLPIDTRQFIAASQMDFESMMPIWEVGLLVTEKSHSMAEIAAEREGTVTTIAGKEAVLLPTNTYLVKLGNNIFGAMAPANRQELARWIRSSDGGTGPPAYIQEAIGYAKDSGTEVIMAIDLRDAVSPQRVEAAAADSKALAQAGIDAQRMVDLMTTARGVMLGITFADRPFGKIKVDFASDASFLKPVAQPLFLEVLANQGAMIDDLKEWTGNAAGSQVTLEGYFSDTGLRRVFSLVHPPAATDLAAEPAAESAADANTEVAATQQYFQSVTKLLRELRNEDNPANYYVIGAWFDKYAGRIDRLPMVNVADEMLDYGQYVAQQLRNASMAIKGVGIQSRPAQIGAANTSAPGNYANGYQNGSYYYNGYAYTGGHGVGFYNYQAGLQAQQQARTQVKVNLKAQGSSVVQAIMNDIKNTTAQVRREMTQKYNVEF